MLWFLFVLASENFILGVFNAVFGINMAEVLASVLYFTLFTLSSRFIVYFLTFILKRVKRSRAQLTLYSWLQLILFPVFTLLTCLVFANVTPNNRTATNLLLVDVIGLIITNVVVLNLVSSLDDEGILKRDNILLNQQIRLEMNNVEALMDAYSTQRKMTHDFENHLLAIRGLAEKNNDTETLKYTQQMLKNISGNSLIVHSNNPVVDAILNQKYSYAEKFGITISFKINDLSGTSVANEDLVTLLANALDNAIEATKTVEKDKTIKVTITNSYGELLISISNPVKTNVTVKNNIVEKPGRNPEHGYGLQNIRMVAGKYNAILNIDCRNNIFTVSAIF